MEVRLGSTSGTLVATMPTVNTGGWSTYKSFTVPVAETTGTHDLYIVFKDRPSGGIMNVDWLELLGETPAVPVTSVSITQNDPTIQIGQTMRLTTTFTPTSPDPPTNQVVTWASDDTDIAMVNANGDVTGIEEGTATITVTTEDGTFTDQVTVTVTQSGPGTYYATRLSGSPTEKYGLAKSLSVMPGDVVDIEVFVKYIDEDPQNWTPLLNNLIAAISIPSGGIFIDGGQPGSLGNETLPFTPLNNDSEPGEAPKAYLNYIIMDRDFIPVDMGAKSVTTAAREYGQNGQHERLFFDDIVVREAGYMYIYISNEGEELVDVFFDDFKVTHVKSPVIQTNDYYPFGLTFNSYQRENSTQNRYLYNQGTGEKKFLTERILDLGLNIDLSKYRAYDPASGRWWQVDPLADQGDLVSLTPYNYSFNNPIRYNDPYGDCPTCWVPLISTYTALKAKYSNILKPGQQAGQRLITNKSGSTPSNTGMDETSRKIIKVTGVAQDVNQVVKSTKDVTKEIAKDGAKAAQETGDTMQKAGIVISAAGLPEVGAPLVALGSGLEAGGVAVESAVNISQGNYLDAAIDVGGLLLDKKASDQIKKVVTSQGMNEQSRNILEANKEVVKEASKKVAEELDKRK